jgi:hypothetical protein
MTCDVVVHYVVACSRLVSFWKEKLCSYLPIDDDTCAMEQHPCMSSSYFHRPAAASANFISAEIIAPCSQPGNLLKFDKKTL